MAKKRKEPAAPVKDPKQQAIDQIVAQILQSGNPQAAFGAFTQQLRQQAGSATDPVDQFVARNRSHSIALPPPPEQPQVLTVRVDLTHAQPPIWRRLDLLGELRLDQVHDVLQTVMGWADSHLHRFGGPGAGPWEPPYFVTAYDEDEGDGGTQESEARLDQVLREPGDRIVYIYDFGDDWIHSIKLEKQRAAVETDPAAVCRTGRNACPPDDVGGIHNWNEIAAALRADPDPRALSGDLEMYADWLPEGVDPSSFDLEETNEALADINERARLPRLHPTLDALLALAPPPLAHELGELVGRAATASPDPTTDELVAVLRPWRCVLETAGAEGIPLTPAGWIAPAACERIWHESGLSWDFGRGNREQNTPEVTTLREACTRLKLIRRHKGRLVLTPLGRRAAADPGVLAKTVAAGLIDDPEPFARDVRAVTLLLLAARWRPTTPEATEPMRPFTEQYACGDKVERIVEQLGWRRGNGAEIRHGLRDTRELLTLLTAGMPDPARSRNLPDSPGVLHLARAAIFGMPES